MLLSRGQADVGPCRRNSNNGMKSKIEKASRVLSRLTSESSRTVVNLIWPQGKNTADLQHSLLIFPVPPPTCLLGRVVHSQLTSFTIIKLLLAVLLP